MGFWPVWAIGAGLTAIGYFLIANYNTSVAIMACGAGMAIGAWLATD